MPPFNHNTSILPPLVFTFGRFNPPTRGHELLLSKVLKTANDIRGLPQVFLSQSQDPHKNPLTFSEKLRFMKRTMPKYAWFISNEEYNNPFIIIDQMFKHGHRDAIMVLGEDRIDSFGRTIIQFALKTIGYNSFDIVLAGKRNESASVKSIEGVSASKLRDAAAHDDIKTFTLGLPDQISEKEKKVVAAELMPLLRRRMGLKKPLQESLHIRTDLGQWTSLGHPKNEQQSSSMKLWWYNAKTDKFTFVDADVYNNSVGSSSSGKWVTHTSFEVHKLYGPQSKQLEYDFRGRLDYSAKALSVTDSGSEEPTSIAQRERVKKMIRALEKKFPNWTVWMTPHGSYTMAEPLMDLGYLLDKKYLGEDYIPTPYILVGHNNQSHIWWYDSGAKAVKIESKIDSKKVNHDTFTNPSTVFAGRIDPIRKIVSIRSNGVSWSRIVLKSLVNGFVKKYPDYQILFYDSLRDFSLEDFLTEKTLLQTKDIIEEEITIIPRYKTRLFDDDSYITIGHNPNLKTKNTQLFYWNKLKWGNKFQTITPDITTGDITHHDTIDRKSKEPDQPIDFEMSSLLSGRIDKDKKVAAVRLGGVGTRMEYGKLAEFLPDFYSDFEKFYPGYTLYLYHTAIKTPKELVAESKSFTVSRPKTNKYFEVGHTNYNNHTNTANEEVYFWTPKKSFVTRKAGERTHHLEKKWVDPNDPGELKDAFIMPDTKCLKGRISKDKKEISVVNKEIRKPQDFAAFYADIESKYPGYKVYLFSYEIPTPDKVDELIKSELEESIIRNTRNYFSIGHDIRTDNLLWFFDGTSIKTFKAEPYVDIEDNVRGSNPKSEQNWTWELDHLTGKERRALGWYELHDRELPGFENSFFHGRISTHTKTISMVRSNKTLTNDLDGSPLWKSKRRNELLTKCFLALEKKFPNYTIVVSSYDIPTPQEIAKEDSN